MDRIMAFAAHPDDEGAMWGTLAKYSRLSNDVTIVWATRGDRWLTPLGRYSPFLYWFTHLKKNPDVKEKLYHIIRKIRTKEINQVLSIINARGEFLEFIDGSVPPPSNSKAVKKVIELIRLCRPRIVLTHHYREAHPDHQNLSKLVYQAFFLSEKEMVKTKSPPFKPEILAWWDERGFGFKPNCFLNVNDSIYSFREWKRAYESQSTRLIGQIPVVKARLRAIGTPYRLVECFQIVNIPLKDKFYGEFFPTAI